MFVKPRASVNALKSRLGNGSLRMQRWFAANAKDKLGQFNSLFPIRSDRVMNEHTQRAPEVKHARWCLHHKHILVCSACSSREYAHESTKEGSKQHFSLHLLSIPVSVYLNLNFHQTNITWIHKTWRGCVFLVCVFLWKCHVFHTRIRPYSISQHKSLLRRWSFWRRSANMLESLRMPLSHVVGIQECITDQSKTKKTAQIQGFHTITTGYDKIY